MSRGSCRDPLEIRLEARMPGAIDATHDEPFQRATGLAAGAPLGLTSQQVRPRGWVHARLGEHDLMEQHVEPAVAQAGQPMTDSAGAGGLNGRNTTARGPPPHAEAPPPPTNPRPARAGGKQADPPEP